MPSSGSLGVCYCYETGVQLMTDKLINKDPENLGGTPVFSGTRVPIRILIEYLEAGDRLDDFLESYPTVSRNQAIEVLERAKVVLTKNLNEAAV